MGICRYTGKGEKLTARAKWLPGGEKMPAVYHIGEYVQNEPIENEDVSRVENTEHVDVNATKNNPSTARTKSKPK